METLKLQNTNINKPAAIRNTVILVKQLPRINIKRNRWYVNGKKMNTDTILKLLRAAGNIVEERIEDSTKIAKEYKGIGITTANGGYMICAKNQEEHKKLIELLIEDNYFYHSCYTMPDKRK